MIECNVTWVIRQLGMISTDDQVRNAIIETLR
jgi:hypothetical protein